MIKIGKQTENRLTVSAKVSASARNHGTKLAGVLAERMAAAGGSSPSAETISTLCVVLGDALMRAAKELKDADQAVTAEAADDVELGEQIDTMVETLVGLMRRLRGHVEDTLGQDGLNTYGLMGEIPREARSLLGHVSNVVNLMKQKPVTAATELGFTFSTAVTYPILESKASGLQRSLRDLDREAREMQEALGRRDLSVLRWIEVYQGVSDTLAGLYRLAGCSDLAERVRSTSRTVSGEDVGVEILEGPRSRRLMK